MPRLRSVGDAKVHMTIQNMVVTSTPPTPRRGPHNEIKKLVRTNTSEAERKCGHKNKNGKRGLFMAEEETLGTPRGRVAWLTLTHRAIIYRRRGGRYKHLPCETNQIPSRCCANRLGGQTQLSLTHRGRGGRYKDLTRETNPIPEKYCEDNSHHPPQKKR